MEHFYSYHQLDEVVPTVRPRLMLDRLAVNAEAGTARSRKAVSIDEQLFQGHFPGNPILPGVLQLAAMLQTAKGLVGCRDGLECATRTSLVKAKKVKFRAPIYPGDVLLTEVAVQDEDEQMMTLKCATSVEGKTTCQGTLTIHKKHSPLAPLDDNSFAPPLHHFEGEGEQEALDINVVMARIPHRFPFLFIDRVLLMDEVNHRIVATKNVTGNEPFFSGQNRTALPTYIQSEIAAQAGCALALSEPGNENKLAFFMSIDQSTFISPALPGDQLLIDVKVEPRGRFGKGHGDMYVGERKISDIDLKFAIVDREDAE